MTSSTLIRKNPDGSEDRYCGQCRTHYLLPVPYEVVNPLIRDLCVECIDKWQREQEPTREMEP